jgi:hypothetical protein
MATHEKLDQDFEQSSSLPSLAQDGQFEPRRKVIIFYIKLLCDYSGLGAGLANKHD